MNKKLVGIVFVVMLGAILTESYFLLVQPNQTPPDAENKSGSTSETPSSSSENSTIDSRSSAGTSTSSQTSIDLSNGKSGGDSVSFVPAVPEFTVELVDTSYDVPKTYSTDPYTGKQVTHQGYNVARRTIEVRIKNEPFTPYIDSDGRNIIFYYNIRIKGHYVEWNSEFGIYNIGEMPKQSNSEYTVISYNSERGRIYTFTLGWVSRYIEVSPGGELDFQVKALVGYACEGSIGAMIPSVFSGKESDWSPTKNLEIP